MEGIIEELTRKLALASINHDSCAFPLVLMHGPLVSKATKPSKFSFSLRTIVDKGPLIPKLPPDAHPDILPNSSLFTSSKASLVRISPPKVERALALRHASLENAYKGVLVGLVTRTNLNMPSAL